MVIAKSRGLHGVGSFRDVVKELERRAQPYMESSGGTFVVPTLDGASGYRDLPVWAAQPYIRGKAVATDAGDQNGPVDTDAASGMSTIMLV